MLPPRLRPPLDAITLASRLLLADVDDLAALLHAKPGPVLALAEAAARHLGDLYLDDECSEFAVTLALCALQTALRRDQPAPVRSRPGAALVAVTPGEPHGLAAALSARDLRHHGWTVRSAFPDDAPSLAHQVAAARFDRLEICLSPALPRPDLLADVAEAIRLARLASPNPALRIEVRGRTFTERRAWAAELGADTVR